MSWYTKIKLVAATDGNIFNLLRSFCGIEPPQLLGGKNVSGQYRHFRFLFWTVYFFKLFKHDSEQIYCISEYIVKTNRHRKTCFSWRNATKLQKILRSFLATSFLNKYSVLFAFLTICRPLISTKQSSWNCRCLRFDLSHSLREILHLNI